MTKTEMIRKNEEDLRAAKANGWDSLIGMLERRRDALNKD
jgi:hypothetical protein